MARNLDDEDAKIIKKNKKAPLNFREALAKFIKLFILKDLLNEYRQEIVQPFEQGVL
jgi:hypothetical protein